MTTTHDLRSHAIGQRAREMSDDGRATHLLALRTRQLRQCNAAWLAAAEQAIAGDNRALRLRVEMAKDITARIGRTP
jgi:hypothetical protein